MNDPNPDRLLQEILTGEEIADFRKASLENGLAGIRRRRQRRRFLTISLIAAAPMVVLLVALLNQSARKAARGPTSVPPVLVASSPARAESSKISFINDDQLFALFPNQSVALVGRPGEQQLVLLSHSREKRGP